MRKIGTEYSEVKERDYCDWFEFCAEAVARFGLVWSLRVTWILTMGGFPVNKLFVGELPVNNTGEQKRYTHQDTRQMCKFTTLNKIQPTYEENSNCFIVHVYVWFKNIEMKGWSKQTTIAKPLVSWAEQQTIPWCEKRSTQLHTIKAKKNTHKFQECLLIKLI